MPHTPAVQLAVPFAEEHAIPQPPQLPVLVAVFVSQPLVRSPSQSSHGAVQTIPQAPLPHVPVPCWLLQTFAQLPQCCASVFVLISQPFAACASQLAYPALHVIPHCPPLQFETPFVVSHATPQPPQFCADVPRLLSQPLEAVASQLP